MARQTVEGRINCGIQVKICSTMLLYTKEGQIVMISTRLLKIEPVYNKGQDTTILNRGSHQQIKRDIIFQ